MRRHEHVLEVPDRVLPERDVAAGGQPVQVDREDDDHQQAEPEVRHGQAEQRDGRRRVVRRPCRAVRRRSPPRECRSRRRSASRARPARASSGMRVDDRLGDRQPARVGAEVALDASPIQRTYWTGIGSSSPYLSRIAASTSGSRSSPRRRAPGRPESPGRRRTPARWRGTRRSGRLRALRRMKTPMIVVR